MATKKGAGAGRWVQIGAVEGPDGKKHGGSPVFIEYGADGSARITKGAPRLTGKILRPFREDGGGGEVEGGDRPQRPPYTGTRHPKQVEAAWERWDNRHAHSKGGGLFGGEDMQARAGFAKLPDGAPVLFTSGEFEGQTGRVVRDQQQGNRVAAEVDGRPGLVPIDPGSVEPLNGSLSWRTETAGGPSEQRGMFTADQFLPRRTADEGRPAGIEPPEAEKPAGELYPGRPLEAERGKLARRRAGLAAGEELTHRQELSQSKGYYRARWAKAARKEGIDPKHLHQLAAEIVAHDKEHVAERRELLKKARSLLATYGGYDARALTTNLRSGRVEDHVVGLDAAAADAAGIFPANFAGYHDLGGRLLDLFAEGVPQPISEDDAYATALEQLTEQKAGAGLDFPFGENAVDDEPIPYARRPRVSAEALHFARSAGLAERANDLLGAELFRQAAAEALRRS